MARPMPRLAPVTSATEPSIFMTASCDGGLAFWSIGIIQIWMSGIIHGMGHSREDKARSHQRIVEIAARRFRESGTAGPGVAELMQAAGLTHGGFYKHFGSRDDLVAEAVQRALAENDGVLAALLAEAADPLAAFVNWYASAEHRDGPGCGVCGGGPRRGRAAFGSAGAGGLHRTGAALPRPPRGLLGDRRRAAAALGTLVGSVLVARAVGPGELSEEILQAARDAVTASARAGAAEPSGADA